MDLVEKYFTASNGDLYIGDIAATTIAENHGTPLFIYDRSILDRKWNLLRSTYPPEFSIYYSVKANPNRTFMQYFLSKDCGLEIASGGELFQALKAGCPPDKIIFAGPGKTESELEYGLDQGIGEFHVESLLEAQRIGAISHRLGVEGRVALRINPGEDIQGGAMRMGGKPAPFGIDEENLDRVLDKVLAIPSIEICGIHLYTGTQILNHNNLIKLYRRGIGIARRTSERLKRPLSTLDFGGGLGIPYFPHERELDMIKLSEGLAVLMVEIKEDPMLSDTQFVLEPGRFLVGESGIYVTRVIEKKNSRGKIFLIVDGGMNHHLAASGNLGQTIKRNFPVCLINKMESPHVERVDVAGPLCTPLDVLARGVELPPAENGDLVGIFLSGAYARTASPLSFLSHPTPPEVWIEGDKEHLIRRRGRFDDYVQDQ